MLNVLKRIKKMLKKGKEKFFFEFQQKESYYKNIA